MRRGEIRLVDLDPARPGEANKVRPAVVVSNDRANGAVEFLGRGVVTVVPLTTNLHKVYPFQVAAPASVTGLNSDSKAQGEQVRAVASSRVGRRVGLFPPHLMRELDTALKLHLDLF